MTQNVLQFNRESQKEIIKRHLLSGGKLTSLSALQLAGSLRLSERIRECEAEGLSIKHKRIKVGTKTVMEYSLGK